MKEKSKTQKKEQGSEGAAFAAGKCEEGHKQAFSSEEGHKKDGERAVFALDGKHALSSLSGSGFYCRYVIDAMSQTFPRFKWLVCAPGEPAEISRSLFERDNVELVTPRGAFWNKFENLWLGYAIGYEARVHGAGLHHGVDNRIPFLKAGLPTVVTVHEAVVDRMSALSARRARRVIAVSEYTKRHLVSDFHIEPEKIDVIHRGPDAIFRPADAAEQERVRALYGLPERYIISVGTVKERKNQLLALKALKQLPEDVSLVLVGRRTDYATKKLEPYIEANGLGGRVLWLDLVPYTDMPALYSAAEVSVLPSRLEGYGLPLVESLACGTPGVAATGSSLEESGGDGALYVNPDDDAACARALATIMEDAECRTRLLEAGRRHIKELNMTNFAKKVLSTYREALLNKYVD